MDASHAMTTYEQLTLAVQGFVALVAFFSMYLVIRQIKILNEQLQATHRASEAQSIISLVEFLQTSEAREARTMVRSVLTQHHHGTWDTIQKQHASTTCANFDVVAALLRANLIKNKDVIIDNWAPTILHCHQVLTPFIQNKRIEPGGDPTYWSNFDWLREQCGKF